MANTNQSSIPNPDADVMARAEFLNFFRSIQAMALGESIPLEYWVPLTKAVAFLRCQGIDNAEQVRDLIRMQVLSVENHTLRDVSLGQRPTYEVNVLAATHVVARWKKLSVEERRQHLLGSAVPSWRFRR